MKKILSLILLIVLFLDLLTCVISVSGESNSSNTLGWELLDDGNVLRIWNQFDSYYFNTTSGIQLTNHYNKYWSHNVMMLGYYNGDEWVLLYRTDELSGFNKNIDLTEDYCNATLWKDLNYSGYEFRLAIRYCLGVDDRNLTVIPYIKNLGIDIPYILGFGWELKDIRINMEYENNFIEINNTEYSLHQELNESYTFVNNSIYVLKTTGYYLYFDWMNNLDYLVTVKNRSGQYNAPVTLFIKVGTLNSGEEKYTNLYWYDSELVLVPTGDYSIMIDYPSSPTTHYDRLDEYPSPDDSVGSLVLQYPSGGNKGDIYNLTNHTSETGTISKITVYYRCCEWSGSTGYAWAVIRPGSINYTGTQTSLTSSFTTYSYDWSTNPDTGSPWSWTDIDNLRIGVNLSVTGSDARCSQLYLTVNYSIQNVTTNESTGVEETNATLNGYIMNGTSLSAFFQYGLDTNYNTTGTNTTKQYPKNEGDVFSANIVGLSEGTVYYFRAVVNESDGVTYHYGLDYTFTTKPEAPTGLTAASINDSIYLSWTKGLGASNTYIERNTSSSWGFGNGTNIYNGTGSYYLDSGLTLGTKYYYQAWGFNNSIFSDNITSVNNITYPGPPTSLSGIVYGTYLNITWTNGTGADTTLVCKKTGGYPTGVTDGTQCQNNTLNYWNETAATGTYYSLWSYNSTLNVYSSQVNYTYGGLLVNCYNANTSLNITNWDIIISDSDGSEVYSRVNNNNTLEIDITECPQGLDTIVISHENYSNAIYYMAIYNGNWYTLNAYLSQINHSALFVIQVIDDYSLPVNNALVTIKKYINTTDVFETVFSIYTDGYGEVEVSLLTDGTLYKVFIEKTGYTTFIADYIPDINIRTKIFKISLTTSNPPSYDTFGTNISFSNVMTGPGYMQLGNITITYNDKNSSTVNTDIYIFSYYNGTYTLVASYHNTSNSFTIVTGSINTTRMHKVVLYFNNSADFIDVDSPFTVVIDALYVYTNDSGYEKFSFDERVTNVFGPFTINGNAVPWPHVIAFGLGFAVLLLFGQLHVGIALIGCGMMIGFVDALFTIYLTDVFPVLLVSLAPIFIVLGIIHIMSKGGREHI